MDWRSFGTGGILGALAVVGLLVWREAAKPKINPAETITFSDKQFYDSASSASPGDGYVNAVGTLTGGDLGNRNNTMTIRCIKDDHTCLVARAEQIGPDQVDEITIDDLSIKDWSPPLIVAEAPGLCSKTTMNIDRVAQTVSFVIVPGDLTQPVCDKAPTQVQRQTLETSLFWQRSGKTLPPP